MPPPAGLHYSNHRSPGIARRGGGGRFTYFSAAGTRVRDPSTLDRIRRLAIPPAWKDVWICPDDCGHIQAVGVDARGRRQYRYHARWSEHQNAVKFSTLLRFARLLPRIRRRVQHDLRLPGLSRDKVLACVVALLDASHLRIGNAEYARDNRSYGLTTMHNKHARVRGGRISFRFRGKSGVAVDRSVEHAAAARIVRSCQDLPGQELFGYIDGQGGVHDVTSTDVNRYLRSISDTDITAKDFRTWGGTVTAFEALLAAPQPQAGSPLSSAECRRRECAAVRAAADWLGNTPATCRAFYIHPSVIIAAETGVLHAAYVRAKRHPRGLSRMEHALFLLLNERVSTRRARRPHPRGPRRATSRKTTTRPFGGRSARPAASP